MFTRLTSVYKLIEQNITDINDKILFIEGFCEQKYKRMS